MKNFLNLLGNFLSAQHESNQSALTGGVRVVSSVNREPVAVISGNVFYFSRSNPAEIRNGLCVTVCFPQNVFVGLTVQLAD